MIPWHDWPKSSRYITLTASLSLIVLVGQVSGTLSVIADWQPLATKVWTTAELDRRRVIRVEAQAELEKRISDRLGDLGKQVGEINTLTKGIREDVLEDRVKRLRFEISQMRFQKVQLDAKISDTEPPRNIPLRAVMANLDDEIESKQRDIFSAVCALEGRTC